MEVRISPELEEELARLAQERGRGAESLVQEDVERLVGYDEWFAGEVKKGLTEIDRGVSLSDEEVTHAR
jgi:predicted transcriptional regulator